jgi:hypothetical protein
MSDQPGFAEPARSGDDGLQTPILPDHGAGPACENRTHPTVTSRPRAVSARHCRARFGFIDLRI